MATHEILYLRANANIPFGKATSTARKGGKWMKAKPGDLLELRYTDGNQLFGWAIVIRAELVSLDQCLGRASENHSCQDRPLDNASDVLADELRAAYGTLTLADQYTMLHFVRMGDASNPLDTVDFSIARFAEDLKNLPRDFTWNILKSFDAIVAERQYQRAERGNAKPDVLSGVGDYLAAIHTYLNKAFEDWRVSRGNNIEVLHGFRKIAALAVACMEGHGAPVRE